MILPLIGAPATGCANGEAAPVTIASSQGSSMPRNAMCLRKSSTVFSVGIRTNLNGGGIAERHNITHGWIGQANRRDWGNHPQALLLLEFNDSCPFACWRLRAQFGNPFEIKLGRPIVGLCFQNAPKRGFGRFKRFSFETFQAFS